MEPAGPHRRARASHTPDPVTESALPVAALVVHYRTPDLLDACEFTLNRAMTYGIRSEGPVGGTIDLCGPPW